MSVSLYCMPCAKLVAPETDADSKTPCPGCGNLLERPATAEVFISYAREDAAYADEVAKLLGAAGITHWLDKQRITLGNDFLDEISQGLCDARAVVLVLSSRAVTSPWVRAEITEAKSNGVPILPLKIEEFDLPRAWRLALAHHQWIEAYDAALSVHAKRIVDDVRVVLLRHAARAVNDETSATSPVAPKPLAGVDPGRSPYVGPQHFRRGMTDRFFGRFREGEVLLSKVARARIVLVYAASGAGKSSLLNTLVHDSLDDQGFEVWLDARVGAALPVDIKIENVRNVFTFTALYGLDRSAPPNSKWRLEDFLSSVARKRGTVGRVLVLDQFEEIFTQHRDRFEDRQVFFEEVAEALRKDPSLRVIFALRQEYLADIDPLVLPLAEEFETERFPLQRIGPQGALEAITKPAEPFAKFAPGVAERIVEQLNTIKVKRSDGTVVEKPGEFIETVHLQIVCDRLWKRLPAGITTIEIQHVESAASGSATLGEFVANALDAFYEQAVEEVANSARTKRHGRFTKELIQLGCMKFVTPSATRTMVQRANGRAGRLPDWIVEQLEACHLLRVEQRGGQLWYELSHDRLAEPVGRQMNREVSELLFASDLLNKVLENTLQGNENGLRGYFREHRDVLEECRPFHAQEGLFADEAEFLFRASLASGQDMREWSRRLENDYPEVRVAVLGDAMSSEIDTVRCHAASLLGNEPAESLHERLVDIALHDPDVAVKRAAAASLARLDRPELTDRLLAALSESSTRQRAFDAAGRVLVAVQRLTEDSQFGRQVERRFRGDRQRIRRHARRERLARGLPVLAFLTLPAVLLASLVAPMFKWLPGMWNWALCQAEPSAIMGVFQGIVAGVLWAGCITFGITYYYVVLGHPRAHRSALQPAGAIAVGAIAGVMGSSLVVLTMLGVYSPDTLVTMGWLTHPDSERLSPAFLRDVFVTTRFGWVYLVTGTGLAISMAVMVNALRASRGWKALFEKDEKGTLSFRETVLVARQVMRTVLPYAWILPVGVTIAAVLAFFVPELQAVWNEDIETKANAEDLIHALIGDCATQIIGAFFAICGMGIGTVVMRRGLQVEPRTVYI